MFSRDYVDMLAGLVLATGGVSVSIYSFTRHSLGSGAQMGSGTFPFAVGLILAILGIGMAANGWMRSYRPISVQVRPALAVLAAISSFAVGISWFGMIPAIIVMTLIAALADSKLPPLGAAVLSIALGGTAYLIFNSLLGLPIRPFRWPL